MAGAWLRRLGALLVDRRGNVSPLMTLMMVPIIGALGMATESSSWFFVQRAAQNAADAAVMAAASNGSPTVAPTYIQEAQAVAVKRGFTNGVDNATVVAINNATCPAPSTLTNCYKVTITKKVPIALTTLVGYNGSTNIGGNPAVLVTASAVASKPIPANACVVALAGGGTKIDGFRLNGGNNFNAKGCDLYSNGSATCNGHDGGFGTSFAFGESNKGCGTTQATAPSKYVDDVFSKVLPNNPQSGCPNKTLLPGVNDWSALKCVNLGTNPTLASGTATVLTNTSGVNKGTVVMVNGSLTVNGTISAAVGQGMSVVFTGASGAKPGFISGTGTIDFGAPTSGPWSGVALYQDPALTTPSSYDYSGNSPAFNITGLIYAPYASLTFKGAINHQTGGYSCIGFIADTMLTSGTGSIFDNPVSQCYQAGLSNLPTSPNSVTVRQALVQ